MNGDDYRIADKCLFFLTPTDFHSIDVQPNDDAYSINISFTYSIIDNMILKNEHVSPCVILNPSAYTSETVCRICDTFTNKPDSPIRDIELRYLLNLLLINILSEGKAISNKHTGMNIAVRNVILYMLTDISKPYSLEELSEKCGLTPPYFSGMFHRETGITFKKWLTDIRMEHAKQLLKNDDYSILDICLECGYGSLSHFIKIFRESTGMTPNTYRSQKQKKAQNL